MSQTCKTCKNDKSLDEYYRYASSRIYKNCKKCHNIGRNKYPRKKSNHVATIQETPSVIHFITPDNEVRSFPFDFINRAVSAEGPETLRVSDLSVQADIGSGDSQEMKIGSG